jgi:DNA-binding MarR family transcriptional regulator
MNTKSLHALSEQQLTNKAYLLGRLGREARRRFTQILTLWNLNPSHYGILFLLEEIDQASQQQLAQHLTIDRANMVDLLDLLEKRGFVERTQDPVDRRRHAVKLTSSGREEIRQMRQAVDKLDQEEFFVGLDSQEQATLHALLIKLFKSLIAEEGKDD